MLASSVGATISNKGFDNEEDSVSFKSVRMMAIEFNDIESDEDAV